jgi:DnaK suppressor protein
VPVRLPARPEVPVDDEEEIMDPEHARTRLADERRRVETLLAESSADARDNRAAEDHPGDLGDGAQPLTAEGTEDAVAESLRARLATIERAQDRLAAGTYGRSVRSGEPIPDERLEADPAAELTVEEASAG